MRDYYNNYGGCIEENCRVLMADRSMLPIKYLKKGDKVLLTSGKIG